MRLGKREGITSAAVFAMVMIGLISVDERVRDRFGELAWGGGQVAPAVDRLADLGRAVWSAVQHQSIENAPVVLFATVGAVLVLAMLRS